MKIFRNRKPHNPMTILNLSFIIIPFDFYAVMVDLIYTALLDYGPKLVERKLWGNGGFTKREIDADVGTTRN